MNTEKDLKKLIVEYKEVRAPKEVIIMAENILDSKEQAKNNYKRYLSFLRSISAVVASFLVIFTLILNTVPTFALVVTRIPILGTTARLLIFTRYTDTGENHEVLIENANIEGISNNEIIEALNSKYDARSKELYEELMAKIDGNIDNIVFSSTYSIVVDNGRTLSIQNSIYESLGSSHQVYRYDTVDIKNEIYITLPSLFINDSYIDVISENIRSQMLEQMETDDNIIYYGYNEDDTNGFERINENHEFYINNYNQLVIVFDSYEIAPGYMGALEFIIPTEVIEGILVGTYYIN